MKTKAHVNYKIISQPTFKGLKRKKVLEYYQETGSHGLSWAIQAGNNHFS
jgi:hypothetical protein